MNKGKHKGPRYEIRFGNGYWKIFDNQFYTSAGMFPRKVDAEEALQKGEFTRYCRVDSGPQYD